ncbi:GDYXXLXY domain-containing protein [Erythrobacter sp.]|uniref:GDYXXLXY domain-containing protein n=1 Tax=Erythrobacter sp. TaxID=1042 RepID=UPI001425E91E|nr:GDYXXLXY domain-containing protein [Erythrobacter sp.]QIQ87288.1 MAG: GDYXXLXY domain-containing protein [Erythrobacter sp.]
MRLARLAALALPLAGLAALWAWSDYASRQGTDWEVPVEGYDPRDLLRGHYVEFTYDWPIREDEAAANWDFAPSPWGLCLSGHPPTIAEAVPFDPYDEAALAACAHPLLADSGGVYGNDSLVRGRLYVGQERAREIEEQLAQRDMRGVVRFRQREDGTFTLQDIRFRPLTPEERAEREGGADREGIEPTAPPIMEEPAPDE